MTVARTKVFGFGNTTVTRQFRLSSHRRGTCVRRFHLAQNMLGPCPSRITTPEKPCNETIARVLQVPEVLPPLIYLMSSEEAAHALDCPRGQSASVLQITCASNANSSAATTELPTQSQAFSSVPRYFHRRNKLYVMVFFGNRHCATQCRDLFVPFEDYLSIAQHMDIAQ